MTHTNGVNGTGASYMPPALDVNLTIPRLPTIAITLPTKKKIKRLKAPSDLFVFAIRRAGRKKHALRIAAMSWYDARRLALAKLGVEPYQIEIDDVTGSFGRVDMIARWVGTDVGSGRREFEVTRAEDLQ